MAMMDNMGDMADKRRRFEELRKSEDDGTIDDSGRQELQQLRSELFGKDTM
jgi:transcription initiation factor TFIIIB Brf1 subunit/transcription initiation factor TFIIB